MLTGSVVRGSRDLGQARRTGTGPQANSEPQEIPAWALSAPRFQITKSGGEQAIKKSGGELRGRWRTRLELKNLYRSQIRSREQERDLTRGKWS